MRLKTYCSVYVYFIEGIGSTKGLLEPIFSFESGANLDCAAHYSKNIYPNKTSVCSPLGMEETRKIKSNLLNIYPNPANNIVSISFSKNIDEVKIMDVLGNIVEVPTPNSSKGGELIQLNTIDLQNGIYFIKIISGKESVTRKLVVSH